MTYRPRQLLTTSVPTLGRDPLCCPYCGGDWLDAYPIADGDSAGDAQCCPRCYEGRYPDSELLDDVLAHFGQVSAAARALHVNRSTLTRWRNQGDHLELSRRMRELLERHAPPAPAFVDAAKHYA